MWEYDLMLLNLNHTQSIEPYQEHDEFEHKQDHDSYEHGDIHYDEDMSIQKKSFYIEIKDWIDILWRRLISALSIFLK